MSSVELARQWCMDADQGPMLAYYQRGEELDRLDTAIGRLEFARTCEIVGGHLPAPPAVVADIGGGPGRYARWLAGRGHRVHHRDVVPLHVEQAVAACAGLDAVETAVGDARSIDLDDGSVDAVLLLGPMYHLPQRADRLLALAEACRVAKPGAPIFVAAISRWAGRLHSVLTSRLYRDEEGIVERLPELERTGFVPPLFDGSFTGFAHRPAQFRTEIRSAGLDLVDLVNVEGPAALLPDLAERLADPVDAEVVVGTARAVQRVPELLGVGPHLLAVARRPGPQGVEPGGEP